MNPIARVNLLPGEIAEQARQRRIAASAAAGVALWMVALGGVYGLKVGEVNDQQLVRAEEQAVVSGLQAELASLAEFGQLAADVEHKNGQLATAMAPEISWARVMNDVALALPANASLQTFAATAQDPGTTQAGIGEIDRGEAVASVQFSGYSVDRLAPGVEATLLELGAVRSFFDMHLATAAEAEIGTTPVTNFDGTSQMDDSAYTGRYENGLPVEGS